MMRQCLTLLFVSTATIVSAQDGPAPGDYLCVTLTMTNMLGTAHVPDYTGNTVTGNTLEHFGASRLEMMQLMPTLSVTPTTFHFRIHPDETYQIMTFDAAFENQGITDAAGLVLDPDAGTLEFADLDPGLMFVNFVATAGVNILNFRLYDAAGLDAGPVECALTIDPDATDQTVIAELASAIPLPVAPPPPPRPAMIHQHPALQFTRAATSPLVTELMAAQPVSDDPLQSMLSQAEGEALQARLDASYGAYRRGTANALAQPDDVAGAITHLIVLAYATRDGLDGVSVAQMGAVYGQVVAMLAGDATLAAMTDRDKHRMLEQVIMDASDITYGYDLTARRAMSAAVLRTYLGDRVLLRITDQGMQF